MIRLSGIGRKLPIPERLLDLPACANGTANLEVSNDMMTIIAIMPIRVNLLLAKDNFYKSVIINIDL